MSIRELLDDGTTPATWKKVAVNRIRFGAGSSGLDNSSVISARAVLAAASGNFPINTAVSYSRVGKQVTVSYNDAMYSSATVTGAATLIYANLGTVGTLLAADVVTLGPERIFPCLVSLPAVGVATNVLIPGEIRFEGAVLNFLSLDPAGAAVPIPLVNLARVYNGSFSYTLP